MKGERDVAWLAKATKVLTAHSEEAARESGTMKGEHDTASLAPAFAVLKTRKKERTQKRHAKARKKS